MTEDTSPENLRKFLENDDPSMRRMGISLAKGSGVPEELYKNIFGLSLWDPEEGNREAAAELVEEIGLENISEFSGWLEPFDEEGVDEWVRRNSANALGGIGDARAVEVLIEMMSDDYACDGAVGALVSIGEPAVEPLIKVLSDDEEWVRDAAKDALKKLGHEVE